MSADHYAECITCGVTLQTPADRDAHLRDTFTAAKEKDGYAAKSHAARTVNPTPEEIAESDVRRKVESALDDCMDSLDRLVYRDRVTPEQVREALRWFPDFANAWDEYTAEATS
ncbi:hypothetical protein [Isoptericola aurantiacus]|uniref:hypothetical protein n=1 Tax=Isoptericola aurantiacus TaxID=3377839 RepID=UPI00383A0A23